jgi:hypothetical protein
LIAKQGIMLGCEVLFGDDIAVRVQGFIEGALGGPCPCKVGQSCPMLPTELKTPLAEAV